MSSFLKKLFVFSSLVVTLALGYYIYSQNATSVSSDMTLGNSAEIESADFLRRLNELKAIQLDETFFSDPRFYSLTDFSSPVQTEQVGDPNPFEVN
jgi:hypothetical protein